MHYIQLKTLSERTRPGRAGFRFAIEFDLRYRARDPDHSTNYQRWRTWTEFQSTLAKRYGKCYQSHWSRKQKNRRWYVHSIESTDRIVFRTEADRTMAMLLLS